MFKYTLDGISVRRNKRERFEGEQIVDVEKLDLRRTEYTLNGTEPYMRYNGRFRTERQLQEETEDLWIRRRNTEQDADDEDYLDDVYGQLSPRLSDITFARLCCISQLCPTADYSNRGFKKEIQLDIDMGYDDNQSDIRLVKNNNSAFIEAGERLRKAAQANWAKSSKLREAVRRIRGHLEQNVYIVANSKPHKILVYCEFLSGLDVLEVGLEMTCPQHPILRIDGQSSAKNRNEAISAFMQDPKYQIMLITVNAGSEAVDLSSADYLLLLHPIWNPAQIQQCIGRTYHH